MNHRKARFLSKIVGERSNARMLYMVLGSVFIIIGLLTTFNQINLSRTSNDSFRMVIKDVFSIASNNARPTITGVVESGSVKVGDKLILVHSGEEILVEVIHIEKFQLADLHTIDEGPENVGLTLSGITYAQVKRGDVLKAR